MHYRTIIISDVHVGTPDSQYKKLYAFLQEHTCDTLILNGDIIDEQHVFLFKWFKRRKKEYTDFLTYVVNKTNQGTTVFYLNGNHDTFRGGDLFPQNGKVILCEDLIYPSGEHTYYICHGQQLDRVKRNIAFVTPLSLLVGAVFYRINRQYNKIRSRLHLPYQSILGRLKQIGKFFMVGNQTKFEASIRKLLQEKKCDGFICGHIHKPGKDNLGGYLYLNSGDRVEHCTAIVETESNVRDVLYLAKKTHI